jgi:hypothetical protein
LIQWKNIIAALPQSSPLSERVKEGLQAKSGVNVQAGKSSVRAVLDALCEYCVVHSNDSICQNN